MAHWAPFNNDANVEDLVESIQRDGAAIIEDFLSPEDIAKFSLDMAPCLDSYRHSLCAAQYLKTLVPEFELMALSGLY